MDALSEVLRVVTLQSAIFFNAEFSAPWTWVSPESCALAPMLRRSGEHVIVYHLLCAGDAYVQLPTGERVTLGAGDLISFPHGDGHELGSGGRAAPIDTTAALASLVTGRLDLLRLGGGGAAARFICGYLVCDPRLCQAFLGGLPRLIKVNLRDDPSGQWLESSLRFCVAEAESRTDGANATLTKLSEVVFGEMLRRYARALPDQQVGWFAGARDAEVGKALTLLHHRHADPWTVGDLAREVGVSRTVLAERFRHFLGETPMAYLMRWRLRLGARALTETRHGVAQIAADVGYESEAAFNRAFKREYGLPPAKYRKDQAGRRADAPP